MKAIAAVDRNWGIGNRGELLFRLPADMKFFRETTKGAAVIMGRKTLESFPGQKPLPGRLNIVLTRDRDYSPQGVSAVHSPDEAEALARSSGRPVFVIGGGEIYSLMLDRCDECLITKVDAAAAADAFFPDLDRDPDWVLTREGEELEDNGLRFRFNVYGKKRPNDGTRIL